MREPFVISRGTQTHAETIVVTVTDANGRQGRGEACGVTYAGETPQTMTAEIEQVRSAVEAGPDRRALLDLLPAGGARCALDGALWDLEAKQTGCSVFELAGLAPPTPVTTAFTIGIRSPDAYEAAARSRADYALLKIKVGVEDPLACVEAVRRGAPGSKLIVDPNQAWTVSDLMVFAPQLERLGVVLLEQPIKVGAEMDLDGLKVPVALCADELVNGPDDLERACGRFSCVNIKLDKTGGLTAALDLADQARVMGFDLMVGCMAGSSLGMAPATVLAQICQFVDLDGPLLQADDWPNGLDYNNGVITPPKSSFWG